MERYGAAAGATVGGTLNARRETLRSSAIPWENRLPKAAKVLWHVMARSYPGLIRCGKGSLGVLEIQRPPGDLRRSKFP